MRTGKHRNFVVDEEMIQASAEDLKLGKGLYGGDLKRMPHAHLGLQASLDFSPAPEIRRNCGDVAEEAARTAFLGGRPLEVEIGFGDGRFLLHRAQAYPDTHFLGFEIHRHLCLDLARRIHQAGLSNLRVVFEDMRQAIPELIADRSLRRCFLFFPDPWWKRRHQKRRLFTPPVLDLLAQKVEVGGLVYIKTDVLPYGDFCRMIFDADPRYKAISPPSDLTENFHPTRREAYCLHEGLPFTTLCYEVLPSDPSGL